MKLLILHVIFIFATNVLAYQEDYLKENTKFPSITPPPKEVSYGSEEWHFDHCNLQFIHHQAFEKHIQIAKSELLGLVFHSDCSKLSKLQATNTISEVEISVVEEEIVHHQIQDTDESYTLEISEGKVKISANQYIGVPRALATFTQLIKKSKTEKGFYRITHLPIHINDTPRYQYRGLMLDTSRRYYSQQTINEVINYMSLAKFNVFHWHIVDDDSFPLELSSNPGITENGAYSEEKVYTKEAIQQIVEYATSLGIKVMPEFDNPGHNRAIGLDSDLTYLIRCFSKDWSYNISGAYRVTGGPPTGIIDPAIDASYDLVEGILSDLNDLFPEPMIHLGGDEVVKLCLSENPDVHDFMDEIGASTYDELLSYWISQIRERLTNVNPEKQGIYWSNEYSLNLRYSDNDILMYWGLAADISDFKSTYPNNWIVFATGDHFYLDCGYGNKYGGESWCDPFNTWWKIYEFDPELYLDDPLVLGGEVPMWSELSGDVNLHSKLWPRIVSLSDMLWNEFQSHIDLVAITDRLETFQDIVEQNGIPYSPITGYWCEINNDHCFSAYGTRLENNIEMDGLRIPKD